MAVLLYPRRSVTLPSGGAALREPFSRGLVAAFAPGLGNAGLTDLVSGLKLTPTGGATLGTAGGTAGLICGAGATARVTAPSWLKLAPNVELVARMSFFGTPVAASGLFGITVNNTATSPFLGYAFDINATGLLRLGYSSGATFREYTGGGAYQRAPTPGQPFTMVGLFTLTEVSIYFGPDIGFVTSSGANPTFSATSELFLGGGTSNVCIEYALMYNRRLTASELKWFRDDPYHWVRPAGAMQFALGAVAAVGPGRWWLTIDGVEQTPAVDSVTISWQLNDRTRATVVISDLIPDRHADLISYDKTGETPLFGGLILTRAFAGRNQYDPDYQITCECGDYYAATDWALATLTYAVDVTLKAVLTDLVTNYLDEYGITLDPAQVDGPPLTPFTWTDKKISDAIRELSERTGYVARMSATKALIMLIPGSEAAPFTVTEATTNAIDVHWRDSEQAQPANFITLVAGPNGQADVLNERHYGDGVVRSWVLDAPYVAHYGALHIFSDLAGGYPVGRYGLDDMPWTVDAATSTVYQRVDQPVIDADDYWWFDAYIGQFPFTVTATTGETPVIHRKETRPDVTSRPVAQAIADSLLEAASGEAKELTLTTDLDGLMVGQAITIDLPVTRSITGEFVITSLTMSIVQDPDGGEAYWVYTAQAIDSTVYQGSYLDQWRKLIGTGGLGAATAGNAGGPLGTAPIYLGGSRGVSVAADPAAWQAVVNYIPYTASSNFTARIRADLSALDPAVGIQARLFNVTDSTVAGTSIVVIAPATTDMFIAVIEAGKTYRLEVIADTDAEEVFAIGTLEAT